MVECFPSITLLGMNKVIGLRKNIVIGYIVFIHILMAFVLVKSDFLPRVGNRLGQNRNVETEITQHFKRMEQYHERMDPNVPSGSAIFIGDSITQGLCVSAVFTPSVNYGIGSDTTFGVLKRLPKYESLNRASMVILEVGVNDLKRRKNEEILGNYSSILKLLPSHPSVIISGILPVNEGIAHHTKGYNARIRGLNSALKDLCESEKPRCTFVDSGRALVDSNGSLSTSYQAGDGVHLNGQGNAIWIQELKNGIKTAQQGVPPDRLRSQ